MRYVVINVMSMVIISALVIMYNYNKIPELEVQKGFGYLLQDTSEPIVFDTYSRNTANVDLTTVSNIYSNMKLNGFSITRYDENESFIEFIGEKDNFVLRIRYENSGLLTSISSPYEKSSEWLSYINEEK